MESPPSCSTWSEVFITSDDSGLLLTSGSISSGSMSGDSRSGRCYFPYEFQNSDFEDKSLSQTDSLDDMSDIMCGENFNTLKKGPNWNDSNTLAIEPPPEFQDKPNRLVTTEKHSFKKNKTPEWLSKYANEIMLLVIKDAIEIYCKIVTNKNQLYYKCFSNQKQIFVTPRTFLTSDWLLFSPIHTNVRPSSRNSLGSSRLSCSHNSLSVPSTCKVDDSNFITQAVSHDTLTSNQISDLYNVPFDSDMYAVPVDVVKPPLKPKRNHQQKNRRRNTCFSNELHCYTTSKQHKASSTATSLSSDSVSKKRHSVAGTSVKHVDEPIHMTLQEVRQYLQTLYSSSSDSSEHRNQEKHQKIKQNIHNKSTIRFKDTIQSDKVICTNEDNNTLSYKSKNKKNSFAISHKNNNKKSKENVCELNRKRNISNNYNEQEKRCPVRNFSSSLKQTLCNLFRIRRFVNGSSSNKYTTNKENESMYGDSININDDNRKGPLASRALPPLPSENKANQPKTSTDYATSIEKVRDYGWYWGPISAEAAERILLNEPDGSFIVRDSSDDHYIFSLTFKLNSGVRHVRIEHDQGNFSFGSCTKFKSHTIIEFIENAVEHSRSGRYLFFLHRRPVLGPMRVQLLHPVSRFKQVQSLQHMCRFVILKIVRKDRIASLPLPRRIIDYLNTQHYYSEQLLEWEELDNITENNTLTQVIEDTRQS